jgi:hypothetical protein
MSLLPCNCRCCRARAAELNASEAVDPWLGARTANEFFNPPPSDAPGERKGGCPCDPTGSDGERCPGKDGRPLCSPSPPSEADKFCDANCVWTDHHPNCTIPSPADPVTGWTPEMTQQARDYHGWDSPSPAEQGAMEALIVDAMERAHEAGRFEDEPLAAGRVGVGDHADIADSLAHVRDAMGVVPRFWLTTINRAIDALAGPLVYADSVKEKGE